MIDDVLKQWGSDQPPPVPNDPALADALKFGQDIQLRSIYEYLQLTNRIDPSITFDKFGSTLETIPNEMQANNDFSLTFRTMTRFKLTPRQTMRVFPVILKGKANQEMIRQYEKAPFLSSSPAGTLLDTDGSEGLLLISSFAGQPQIFNRMEDITPKLDMMIQAIVGLLCHPTAQFVEIVLRHRDWLWVYRLRRNDDYLDIFLIRFAPLIFKFGRLRHLAREKQRDSNITTSLGVLQTVVYEEQTNFRQASQLYVGSQLQIRVLDQAIGIHPLRWDFNHAVDFKTASVKNVTMFRNCFSVDANDKLVDSPDTQPGCYGWSSSKNGAVVTSDYFPLLNVLLQDPRKAFDAWPATNADA